MTTYVFDNNILTTLAAPLASGATSMSIASGAGLPTLSAGQALPMTLKDAATGLYYEIVYVTAISGTTLTVTRGQEGTGDLNWTTGDYVFSNLTAGIAASFSQAGQVQSGSLNYGVDTGTANNYIVALTPALTAYVDGMAVRFKASHANTGASTLNAGAGAAPILGTGGTSLGSGVIVAGQDYEVIYTSASSAWLLLAQTGGQFVVPTATISGAAVNLAQLNAAIPAAYTSGGSTALAVPAAAATAGTVAATGWRKEPDGTIRNWAVIQLADGSNITFTYPTALTTGVTAIRALSMSTAAGQSGGALNATIMAANTPGLTSCQFVVHSTGTPGTLVAAFVEIEGK